MPIPPGTYALGPDDATLTVHTRRTGAAQKAGHDLLIVVESWRATLEIADDGGSLALDADARSLRVLEGTGGITTLGDDDKAGIAQTIDEEVLKGAAIAFRSRSVAVAGDGLTVEGDLELAGASRPVTFDLAADGGRLTGRAVVRQTDFGIKPYSALFGTLKVADEVEVGVDAPLPTN